jgi:hypothetical protein
MELVYLVAVVALAIVGTWVWWRFRQLKRYLLKAAEYAGFTQNNYEMFGRGKEPSPEQLIYGIRQQPARLGLQGRHLAARLAALHNSEVELMENAQERLELFLQVFEGDYARQVHFLQVFEPGAMAVGYAECDWCPPELRSALLSWDAEIRLWVQVVRWTLNHWKHRHRASLESIRA